jgi:hypothetical protein
MKNRLQVGRSAWPYLRHYIWCPMADTTVPSSTSKVFKWFKAHFKVAKTVVTVSSRTLDIVNVMTYDLDGAWDTTRTGHQAPLFKGPHGMDSTLNVVRGNSFGEKFNKKMDHFL